LVSYSELGEDTKNYISLTVDAVLQGLDDLGIIVLQKRQATEEEMKQITEYANYHSKEE